MQKSKRTDNETAWEMYRRLWSIGKAKQICISSLLKTYDNSFHYFLQKKIDTYTTNFIYEYSEEEAIKIMKECEDKIDELK